MKNKNINIQKRNQGINFKGKPLVRKKFERDLELIEKNPGQGRQTFKDRFYKNENSRVIRFK